MESTLNVPPLAIWPEGAQFNFIIAFSSDFNLYKKECAIKGEIYA
jgi:hypothetical protein